MEDQQLNKLFDYTKFHIGIYTTLISGLFAVIAFAHNPAATWLYLPALTRLLKVSAVLIIVAGAAAGAIASNIPEHPTFASFSISKLKLFGWTTKVPYTWVVHLEHASFWAAIAVLAVTFLRI
jgi:hypothetical protein